MFPDRFSRCLWCFISYALQMDNTEEHLIMKEFLSYIPGQGLFLPAGMSQPVLLLFCVEFTNLYYLWTIESEPLMLTCKSAAVPCCCVGCCRERLKIARIPQTHKLPQASFRSRISKDACVYPSLCTLFLTTQHPRSFLCLHRPERWLSFTPCTLTKPHFSFLIQETVQNIFVVCFFSLLSNQPFNQYIFPFSFLFQSVCF